MTISSIPKCSSKPICVGKANHLQRRCNVPGTSLTIIKGTTMLRRWGVYKNVSGISCDEQILGWLKKYPRWSENICIDYYNRTSQHEYHHLSARGQEASTGTLRAYVVVVRSCLPLPRGREDLLKGKLGWFVGKMHDDDGDHRSSRSKHGLRLLTWQLAAVTSHLQTTLKQPFLARMSSKSVKSAESPQSWQIDGELPLAAAKKKEKKLWKTRIYRHFNCLVVWLNPSFLAFVPVTA